MTDGKTRKIFINLPVHDLERAKKFFARLGFAFNPQFTDEKAACMIVSEEAYVMLLTDAFFKTFTRRKVCDTASQAEALFALSCESRAEVDDLVRKAVAAGGSHAMDPQDHGFMYGWSFCDPDGHQWEVIWMDPSAIEH
ncbi:MAG: VOC family protein [Acidobacteriota bacterium]